MDFRKMTEREIEHWYYGAFAEAFAENERKPLADIFALISEGRYELWGLFEEAEMLGYAAIWKRAGIPLRLLDYLGVVKERRNGGLGASMLSLLREQGVPTVTESELP
ncbi:MAG: N-acetyltransferase, partial [Oscillospiraceae bacterium]|nr:N-acetyltransferase [Oscillospiraceae bacterium]